MGISHLILEGDSLIVIEAIKSTNTQEFSCNPIIREIQLLLSYFQFFEVLHIGR